MLQSTVEHPIAHAEKHVLSTENEYFRPFTAACGLVLVLDLRQHLMGGSAHWGTHGMSVT